MSDIEESDFTVDYYPIEIGSRGFISKENESRLKSFFRKVTKERYNSIKPILCKTALTSSFVIYHSKYEDSWLSPKYVTFER